MSIKVFGSRFKTPAADNSAGPSPEALAAAAIAGREKQIADNKVAQLTREKEELARQVESANRERDATLVKNAILSVASSAEFKATNPEHVYRLHRDEFIVHNGKVVSKSDPTKEPAMVLGEFFKAEGKYLLGPSVPGGSGAPAVMTPPAQVPARDMTTNEGLTRVTRNITDRMLSPGRQVAAPAAQVVANTQAQATPVFTPPSK